MRPPQIDIELALQKFAGSRSELQRSLHDSYLLEDRMKQGWGLVIRKREELNLPLAQAIDAFLNPLATVQQLILDSEPTLRIAVFNPNVTCTVLLPRLDKIAAIGAKLELSVYPAEDVD